MSGFGMMGQVPVYDWELYIYGNRTCFKTPLTGNQLFWAPDMSGGKTTNYTDAIPSTAERTAQGTQSATGIVFKFRQSKMYVMDMPWWAITGLRRRSDDTRRPETISDETRGGTGKSNVFGIQIGGPFSWMARLMKSAGAKLVYNVSSPKVLFRWTAYDLAKYADRIALATQRGVLDHVNAGSDSDDD